MNADLRNLPSLRARAFEAFGAGRHDVAESLFSDIRGIAPDDADALQHLGLIALGRGDFARSLDLLSRAVVVHPRMAQAHCNFGNALAQSGRLIEAVTQFREAISLQPDLADAYSNLGLALTFLGETDEAVFVLRRAIALRPTFLEAHVNLGGALLAQKRAADATEVFRRALALQPGHAGVLTGLAQALMDQGRAVAAMETYREALAHSPGFAPAYVNLSSAQMEAADLAGAIATLREGIARNPNHGALRSNLLLALQYDPDATDAAILAESRLWEKAVAAVAPPPRKPIDASRRTLRIGLVSADFRAHPVGWFLRGVLAALGRHDFQLVAYANQTVRDAITDEIARACQEWRFIQGLADAQVAAQVEADRIDILIDLSGHTAGHRLGVFALRPAPLQVSWLGYFATTGLSTIDCVLMDADHVPPEARAAFSERVEYLSPSRFCYRAPDYSPAPAPPPSAVNGFVTFGGFNNAAKLNDAVIAVWSAILARVPHSRLVLKWKSFTDPLLRDRLHQRFGAHGIPPGRVQFQGAEAHDAMLLSYREIDIALDPFPFSGATTTCEALWMGVPVVTWPGSRPVSRQSAALLRTIGLAELCASSADDYVDRAVQLAGDGARLAEIRAGLRRRMGASPLCDGEHFAAELAGALRRAWHDAA